MACSLNRAKKKLSVSRTKNCSMVPTEMGMAMRNKSA